MGGMGGYDGGMGGFDGGFNGGFDGGKGGKGKGGPPVASAIKMLLSSREASSLIGAGGGTSKQIAEATGTKLHLSGKYDFYPGTQMQELCIKGQAPDAVGRAVVQIYMKLSEEHGKILGGEWDVEPGGARVHFVVPTLTARAIIGKAGETIKHIRQISGMKVHVEEMAVGEGDLAEQVISLAGPIQGIQPVLPIILEKIGEAAAMPWFSRWAYNIHSEASGKGKDVVMKGKGKGKDAGKGPGPGPDAGPDVSPVDMLSSAVTSIPPNLADPQDMSQSLQFKCPIGCVGGVMGQNGSGSREISIATNTRIDVKQIDGNFTDQAIVISGNAVGVIAAYMHLQTRLASLQEMLGAGVTGVQAAGGVPPPPGAVQYATPQMPM